MDDQQFAQVVALDFDRALGALDELDGLLAEAQARVVGQNDNQCKIIKFL